MSEYLLLINGSGIKKTTRVEKFSIRVVFIRVILENKKLKCLWLSFYHALENSE